MIETHLKSSALISQWENGLWSELSVCTSADLNKFDDRAELALMVAAANLKLMKRGRARELFKQAVAWGADRDKQAYYLLSVAYSSLYLARSLSDDTPRAETWRARVIKLADQTESNVLRLSGVCEAQPYVSQGNLHEETGLEDFRLKKVTSISLGNAWAGNTVNTVVFRHHGMLTVGDNQYTGFYVDEHTLRIVKRRLSDNSITTFDIEGSYNLKDAHNSISLGADRSGIIHIAYDHHETKLRYRRSINPHDITAWTDELAMTGAKEEKITYPTFIEPKGQNPLLLLYRDGAWNKGTTYLKRYDEEESRWYDYEKPLLSGSENKPWTSNAYWNHPAVGEDGRICLTYVWRTDYYSDEKRVNNVNVGFAQSYDAGVSWFASNNQPYKLPITQVNSEVLFPIPPGSNLINQTSMALDSKGFPHMTSYCNDGNGIPQYLHLWFDGKVWSHSYVSNRTRPFVLAGGGTLRIPISRPEIIIDEDDQVYIIFRSEESRQRMSAVRLTPPLYRFYPRNIVALWDEDIGQSEPVVDRMRWERDRVLSMFIQCSDQPDHEGVPEARSTDAVIVDIQFK